MYVLLQLDDSGRGILELSLVHCTPTQTSSSKFGISKPDF